MSDVNIAILLALFAVILVTVFLKYKAGSSERRMMQMLQRAGLDPEIACAGDTVGIIREVRRRCRSCQSEDRCRRWLAGQEEGENSFCPNALVFKELRRTS